MKTIKSKGLYAHGRQIRVWITPKAYELLKKEAKESYMSLEQYAGLKLSGFTIKKPSEIPEVTLLY